MQNRKGIEMTDEEKAEWQKAFTDIELAINNLMGYTEWQGVHNETTRKRVFKNKALYDLLLYVTQML